MTEIEQVDSVAGRYTWTKAADESRAKVTDVGDLFGLIGVLLLVGGAFWSALRPGDFAVGSTRWHLPVLQGGLVLGALLLGLGHWVARRQRVRMKEAQSVSAESLRTELRVARSELTARMRAEKDARAMQEKLQAQVAELTHARDELSAELNRRRQTERNLSQQQLELLRSKDVLQLHVQARTQELEKLQRRSELILNSAGDGICGLDLQGRITFANPAAARILRQRIEELIGLPEAEVFAGFRAEATGAHPKEIAATRRDGSTFVAEFVCSPLTENGKVIGEVLLFKDITERKAADEALALKASELARSNAELEQFAFVASHDLQEPLRKIQAFGDRLKTKCDEAKLEAGRDYLERMQNAAARMRNLIDDLLTFSRVISRTEPFAAVNLRTVVQDVLGDLEFRIEKTGAKVEVGELPTIDADATQMRQLMQNLISNALKFQAPGATPEVSVTARLVSGATPNGQTTFLARKTSEAGPAGEETFCELTVRDNGIGFDEKYLDKIFAVFQRLHGRQEYEGTGVGLAVCRRIVDRHAGRITAQSKPGAGASFIIWLPVRQKPANPAAA